MWSRYANDVTLHNQPFNILVKEEIERRLRLLPHIVDCDAEIEIASISFAYKNREIIQHLTNRGNLLTTAKYQDIPKIDDELNKIIKEKSQEIV